ncbi:protein of unknown function [Pseudomonas mediterranea]
MRRACVVKVTSPTNKDARDAAQKMNKSVDESINSDFSDPARVPLASGTFVRWRAPFKGLALYIF